ncbi:MAG: dienelactone hydrolase family protein, partial [Burkholderiales bacterium]
PNPLVTIHKYLGADHAFARHGGKTYSKPEADQALELTVSFFRKHLAAPRAAGGPTERNRGSSP